MSGISSKFMHQIILDILDSSHIRTPNNLPRKLLIVAPYSIAISKLRMLYCRRFVLGGGGSVQDQVIPQCLECNVGQLVPLSDYGSQGAAVHYKAWVCTNPKCGFNMKIRNGDIYLNEPISSGASHSPRMR